MSNKVLGTIGFIFGIVGVGYAVHVSKKMDVLCQKLDKTVDDVSKEVDVDIPQSIVEAAVDKAVKREVGRNVEIASNRAVDAVRRDIHEQVKAAVDSNYTDIRNTVSDKISSEVAKIDMDKLSREVTAKAEAKIIEKFDGNLDDILDKFNSDLRNVSKIYKAIANTMTHGNSTRETVLRIS